eukprot:6210455-Pleurochrysis_carterae.AAC.6
MPRQRGQCAVHCAERWELLRHAPNSAAARSRAAAVGLARARTAPRSGKRANRRARSQCQRCRPAADCWRCTARMRARRNGRDWSNTARPLALRTEQRKAASLCEIQARMAWHRCHDVTTTCSCACLPHRATSLSIGYRNEPPTNTTSRSRKYGSTQRRKMLRARGQRYARSRSTQDKK